MEIDPKIDPEKLQFPSFTGQEIDEATKTFISEIMSAVPGIDEAMSFAELIQQKFDHYEKNLCIYIYITLRHSSLNDYEFDIVVFDTAPTGHTLRLLNFPELLDRGIEKILTLKSKFSNLVGKFEGMFGSKEELESTYDQLFSKLEKMKKIVEQVNEQMKDPVKMI